MKSSKFKKTITKIRSIFLKVLNWILQIKRVIEIFERKK